MKIQAKVIAHSKNEFGDELVSFVVTFPRIVLAEAKTHRLISQDGTVLEEDISLNIEQSFSRNSASSRAIPTNKMIQSLRENPFIPIAWQKEHKGMQGTEYITNPEEIAIEENEWLSDLDYAIQAAEARLARGVTKQIANRPLEAFMWHTVVITTSKEGLDNFFDLRCPQYSVGPDRYNGHEVVYKSRKELQLSQFKIVQQHWSDDELFWLTHNKGQAEIHMMALAESMYDAYNESVPELLYPGQWHIPYKKEIKELYDEANLWTYDGEDLIPNVAYVSSVMCARVSFTVPGHDLSEWSLTKYITKALDLANAKPLHASPFEHAAYSMSRSERENYIKGKISTYIGDRGMKTVNHDIPKDVQGWCRNYRGFVQLRHIIETRK